MSGKMYDHLAKDMCSLCTFIILDKNCDMWQIDTHVKDKFTLSLYFDDTLLL